MPPSEPPVFGVGFRGYARPQVDTYIASMADDLVRLQEELDRLRRERDAAQEAQAEAQRLQVQASQEHEALVQQLQRERDDALAQVVQLQSDVHASAQTAAFDPYPAHPLEAQSLAHAPALAHADGRAPAAPGAGRSADAPWQPGGVEAPEATQLRRPLPPRPEEGRRLRRRAVLVPLLLLLAATAAAAVWWFGFAQPDATGDAPRTGSAPSNAPVSAPGQAAEPAPPAAPAVASPAPIPDGWTTQRAEDGSWTVGLPAGWTTVGQGTDRRFVSASGLTTMWVRTARIEDAPSPTELGQYEAAYSREHPGYERLAAEPAEHLGHPARVWEYVHGSGSDQQQGSDLGVLVDDRGYWLHVESRSSSWRFAEPLVEQLRSTFVPA